MLKERSLAPVMMQVLESRFSVLGSGSGDYRPAPPYLIPSFLVSIGTPRLFCAVKETDKYVVAQIGGYILAKSSKSRAFAKFNEALALIKVYDLGDWRAKEPYVSKQQQILN